MRKTFVLDFSAVPLLDSTAANAMRASRTRRSAPGGVYIAGATPQSPRADDPRRHPAAREILAKPSRGRLPTSKCGARIVGRAEDADSPAPEGAEPQDRRQKIMLKQRHKIANQPVSSGVVMREQPQGRFVAVTLSK